MRKIGNIYNNSGGMKKIGNIHDKNFGVQPNQNKQNVQLQSQQFQQQGQQASDFLAKPWYKQIFTKNFAREIPRGTADVLLKQPVRTATSIAEAGYNFNPIKGVVDFARGRQGTYDTFKPFNTPVGEIKTFARNAGEVAGDVVEGRKPLSSAAWQFAEVPLSVMELAGIGKGLGRGFGTYKAAPTVSQGIKQAAPEILDAFVPTTRSVKSKNVVSKIDDIPSPLHAEARKYRSAEEALNDPAYLEKLKKARGNKTTSISENLYHTTSSENLESIARNGLTTGNKARFEGVSSKGKISLSANEKAASYYGGENDVMIRVKKGYNPKDLQHDLLAGGEGTYTTTKNIPPEMLEVKVNGKWQPLKSQPLQEGGTPLIEEARSWSELQNKKPDLFNTGILRRSKSPMGAKGAIPDDVHSAQAKWQNYGQNDEIPAKTIYKRVESGSFKGEYEDKFGNAVRGKNDSVLQDVYDDATGEWIEPTISNKQLKDNLLDSFSTKEGKKYLDEVVASLPKNTDGTITAYRIGKIGEGPQSYTLSDGMAKTFSNQGTDIPIPGTPGLPKGGYKDFGVLPVNKVKIDPKGIKAWSPYDAEILVEPKYVKSQPLQEGGKSFRVFDKNKNVIGTVEAKDFYYAEDKAKAQFGDKYSYLMTNPKVSLQEGGKTRGLIETIKKSPEYSAEMTETLEGAGGYSVRQQKPLVDKAQRLIATNAPEAERIATTEISDQATVMSDELLKHYDKIAQTAKQSGDIQTFEKAMSKARSLALQTDVNLRESGRAISAANRFNKQSPEGMLRTLQEIAEQKGAKLNLTNDQIFNFQRQAQEIAGIVDERARALKTFELMDEVYDSVPGGMKDKLYEALNLPRAIMATADLSAPLRQGIFTAAIHPVKFFKNIGNMLKYAFSDKAFKNLKADIVTSPNYELYVKHKLPLTDISTSLNLREEAFISQLSEKIPLFGRIAKGSNRAYAGFLNKMRTDLFDDFVETAKLNNIADPKFFDDAARFVGSATGRGDIAKLFGGNEAGKVWASFFFSPRLMSSRMSLINPVYYAKLHPAVRKEALKSLVAFVGTGIGILSLAKANGAEVGTDPRSADFGKIKVGNTRFDTWGGFQQYARLIGQLATGEKISTTTGKQTELGSGFGTPTRESIIMDFFKSKEAPILSFLTRWAQGEQFGEPFRLGPEVIDRFIPMVIQDAFDLQREWGGKGIAMATPAIFGVGSQTYGDQIPMVGTTKSNAPTVQWRQEPSLGESIYNNFTGTEISNVPQDMRAPLAEERQTEQLRQIEYEAAKARVLETGRPETVGDTYIYLQNGIPKSKKLGDNSRTPLKDKILYQEIQKRNQKTNPFFTTE